MIEMVTSLVDTAKPVDPDQITGSPSTNTDGRVDLRGTLRGDQNSLRGRALGQASDLDPNE
jgi:hypothetical protein